MAEKEDFFQELDQKARRSFCSCQTLALGFLLLVIVAVVGIVYVGRKITQVVLPGRTVEPTRQDALQLQDKVSQLATAPGASTSLTITEAELTAALRESIARRSNFPVKGIQAEIEPSEIILTGESTKLIKSILTIHVIPKVVDGQPKLELVKIEAGSFAVPQQLTKMIAENIEGLLADQFGQLSGVTIKSMILDDGRMRISGTVVTPPSPS